MMCFSNQKESFSPRGYKKNGILSIEAAFVIPVFLMAMISVMSVICILFIDMKIKEAVYEEAKTLALKNSINEGYGIDGARAEILSSLGNDISNSLFIDDSKGGLDFSFSDFSNPEIINITVIYHARIPYDLFNIVNISFTERAVCHTWTGYKNGLYGNDEDDVIVYITKDSQVYHRIKECSHLRLNIIKTSGEEVKKLRNSGGGKYKSCSLCHSNTKQEVLYITSDGDKYHSSLSCSGLKRSFYSVPLSKVGDKRPCSRCGY